MAFRLWSLLLLLATLLLPVTASASTRTSAETRVGGFEFAAATLVGVSDTASPRTHQGNRHAYGQLASGETHAARGAAGAAARAAMCFAEGTLVTTESGLRPIEEVRVGDVVLAKDDESGEITWESVTETFVTESKRVLRLALRSEDGVAGSLLVTAEHPLWSLNAEDWVTVGELAIGDRVDGLRGPLTVVAVEEQWPPRTVYNFTVSEAHTYFVGEIGVWAHNNPWDMIADFKYSSWDKLGAAEQAKARQLIDTFQQRYVSGAGEKLHSIRNVRNLGNGLYEIKAGGKGAGGSVRVFLDKSGNVIGYANKNTQAAAIARLKSLLAMC